MDISKFHSVQRQNYNGMRVFNNLKNVEEKIDRRLGSLEVLESWHKIRRSVGSGKHQVKIVKMAHGTKGPAKPKRQGKESYSEMRMYFRDYCNYTTIHGFKYLGEMDLSLVEKIWWIIIIILSMSMCASLIYVNFVKWDRSPIYATPSSIYTPIWNVPFPAITVCIHVTVKKDVYNFSAAAQNVEAMSEEELKKFQLVTAYCSRVMLPKSKEEFEFLEEISVQLDELLEDCSWDENVNETCSDLFAPLLLRETIRCYSFNMLDREELFKPNWKHYKDYMKQDRRTTGWTLEKGYPPNSGINDYPRRAKPTELQFSLKSFGPGLDPSCRAVRNFLVFFHNPIEVPSRISDKSRYPRVILSSNKRAVLSVKPRLSVTSSELKSYSPSQRFCYFEGEKRLAAFKIYSHTNCERECLANLTAAGCGCSLFNMAQLHNKPICGLENTACVDVIDQLFWSYNTGGDTLVQDRLFDDVFSRIFTVIPYLQEMMNSGVIKCRCYPTCTTLTYEVEKIEFEKSNDAENSSINNVNDKTDITITFDNYLFNIDERKKLFEFIDFASNCGGLLGLFSGISFVSIFEIFYFLTLRLWCSQKRSKKVWAS